MCDHELLISNNMKRNKFAFVFLSYHLCKNGWKAFANLQPKPLRYKKALNCFVFLSASSGYSSQEVRSTHLLTRATILGQGVLAALHPQGTVYSADDDGENVLCRKAVCFTLQRHCVPWRINF